MTIPWKQCNYIWRIYFTAEEAVERLRYNKVNNQVSFHTEKALQYVKLVRRVSYARKDI